MIGTESTDGWDEIVVYITQLNNTPLYSIRTVAPAVLGPYTQIINQ
jgi:hypothetical protein